MRGGEQFSPFQQLARQRSISASLSTKERRCSRKCPLGAEVIYVARRIVFCLALPGIRDAARSQLIQKRRYARRCRVAVQTILHLERIVLSVLAGHKVGGTVSQPSQSASIYLTFPCKCVISLVSAEASICPRLQITRPDLQSARVFYAHKAASRLDRSPTSASRAVLYHPVNQLQSTDHIPVRQEEMLARGQQHNASLHRSSA